MTKDELNSVGYTAKLLKREMERYAKLDDWIKRITQELDGLPHEQGYQRSSIEELITQKIDCERNINELKYKHAMKTAALVKELDDQVVDHVQKTILIERYCFGKSFDEIAESLHFSNDHIFYLHRKGLKALGLQGQRGRFKVL